MIFGYYSPAFLIHTLPQSSSTVSSSDFFYKIVPNHLMDGFFKLCMKAEVENDLASAGWPQPRHDDDKGE